MMDAWTCDDCKATGDTLVNECPACEGPLTLTMGGQLATIRSHQKMMGRARAVAKLLGHGSTEVHFDDAYDGGIFEVEWTTRCGRGCCPPEGHRAGIPLRYLWTSDDVILAEKLDREERARKVEVETKRLTSLRQAEEAVALSRSMASGLAEMEARLAALRAEAP